MADRTTIKLGAYAWALLGIVGVVVLLMIVVGQLTIVVIPLGIALFPAAVLTPLAMRLKQAGMRDAAVATLLVVGTLLVIVGLFSILVPLVSAEFDNISAQVSQGIERLDEFLRRGAFGLPSITLSEVIDRAQEQAAELIQTDVVTAAAGTATRFATGLILFLFALFFYLKDGPSIAAWLRRQFPASVRDHASEVGNRVWTTIGSYFRGQLLVALIDAVGIALGLAILRVPLALPVGILVFFGSLFPVIGALLSGFVAVIIALATRGFVVALIVLAIVIAVQQIEGNLLQPLILGRATSLHPLAVIASLIAGGTLLGLVGAFIAVPVVASAWQAIKYLREPGGTPAPDSPV